MRKSSRCLLLSTSLLLAIPAVADTALVTTALGGDGEVYRLLSGRYGELFPEGMEADETSHVLALEIQKAEAEVERLLVPGTAGREPEEWASLVTSASSGKLFLVWESHFNSIHPLLSLLSYDGSSWSDRFDVVHSEFTPKTSPRLLVMHDETASAADEAPRQRLLLHLVWTEIGPDGLYEGHYAALTFQEGEFLGHSEVYSLDELLGEPSGAAVGMPPTSTPTVQIQQGRDSRTVLVVFYSNRLRRLATVELDVLPNELVRLADTARAQIIDVGARISPDDVTRLATTVHDLVLAEAADFHPEIARAIADEARAQIIDVGARLPRPDLRTIADHARAQIIDVGAKLSGRGLRRTPLPLHTDSPPAVQLDLSPLDQPAGSPQLAIARPVRLLPPLEAPTSIAFLQSSEDGSDAVVAWRDAESVRYVETAQDAWSSVRVLSLSDDFDWSAALDLLTRRVRNR